MALAQPTHADVSQPVSLSPRNDTMRQQGVGAQRAHGDRRRNANGVVSKGVQRGAHLRRILNRQTFVAFGQ